ncbi:MAG: hypothetical protein IM591_12980 [Chitinophagaceae bacterium]|nr:hypothetical protein [Chitinophagaceae bacterium]
MDDNKYTLNIDLSNYVKFDEFALLANQDYNYGNTNHWFLEFRGGLFGFFNRIKEFAQNYEIVHEWIPEPKRDPEINLSAIFFNMDSGIECLTYALNAFGNAFAVAEFYDISESSKLKKINPTNIIGKDNVPPLSGYLKYFPTLQAFWQSNQTLLSIIFDLHDVSKHRKTIFQGGMSRLDPPPGFYETLGITDIVEKSFYWPMAEIILQENPKEPFFNKKTNTFNVPNSTFVLEDLAPDFCNFINTSGRLILEDSKNNIALKIDTFTK